MILQEIIAEQGKKVVEAHSIVSQLQSNLESAQMHLQREVQERERLEGLLDGTNGILLKVQVRFGSKGPKNAQEAFDKKKNLARLTRRQGMSPSKIPRGLVIVPTAGAVRRTFFMSFLSDRFL
jgi:hypothetical protein